MPITQNRNSSARSLARGLPQGMLDFGELVEFVSEQAAAVAGPAPAPPVIEVPAARTTPCPATEDTSCETTEPLIADAVPVTKSKRGMPKRVRLTFEVPARLNAKLEKLARKQDQTKTAIHRAALTRYLNDPSTSGGDE